MQYVKFDFNLLSDLKQETSLFVGILVYMSSWNFMLSWVEHEKIK